MPLPAHTYTLTRKQLQGEFFYRLVAQDTRLTPAALLLMGYAKVESLSIAELNDFVITAPSQEMSVADETGEALFVCFDGVMTKLHNMKAYEAGHLLAGEVSTRRKLRPHRLWQTWAETMTMEMTTPVPSQCLLRWKLVVEAGGSIKAQGASDKVKKASKT
ncbi:hypothetical protein F2Q70_00039143 [Brassica cretica]|uniref:Uncharacterized protein n=1 Tax=Brassica cretica TaxID=69181 RepID=A0A8S9KAP1_BRACR|nr:hypothetical protein F2Q70_00039143 [Brassica cretica]